MNRLSIYPPNCHGCGLCAGICPTDALSMKIESGKYLPFFSSEKCINCKKCENICNNDVANEEIKEVTNEEIKEIGKEENLNFHPYIGYFHNCYVGYSTNLDIRKKSASGGLVTSLLIYLIKSGKVDGVIVTKLRYKGEDIETYPFIARTEEDILSASGSFYLPVNFSEVIRDVTRQNVNEKFAIVALPCVISNLRNAKIPILHKKIKYMFGLLCSNNFNYSILEFLKYKMKISNYNKGYDIQHLNFRSEWPEFILSIRTSNKEYKLYPRYWNFSFPLKMYVMSHRCMTCKDLFADSADISFGDAWLPSIKKRDKLGTSICISKTKIGEELLTLGNTFENIFITPINSEKIADSQKFAIYFKKIQNIWIKKYEDKNENDKNKFIPQLLVTIPITILLDWLTFRYPEIMKRLPFFVYRILYYIIIVNIVTGYRYANKNNRNI